MKVRCNVCTERPVIDLPKPVEGETICCPICDKQLAYGVKPYRGEVYWSILHNYFIVEFGLLPVEIVEL